MPSKAEEAELLMKSAKKHQSKSITKWSADWDSAATDFEKAAQIYTHLGIVPMAKEAWLSASNAHEKAKNLFFAAKSLEFLANFLKEQEGLMSDPAGLAEVTKVYVRASRIYALDNKPDRQADALTKAARVAPASEADSSAKLIVQALDALEDSNKHHSTPDLYRGLILLQVRASKILDAITTLKRHVKALEKLEQHQNGAKAGLEIIILCLSLGDWVLADREFKALQDSYGFAHSKEQSSAYSLLSCLEERDAEGLKEALKDTTFQFLIPEIGKMAKKITIGGVANVKKKAGVAQPVDDDDMK